MPFHKETVGKKIFIVANYLFLAFISFICIFPMLHIVALSLSSKVAVSSGSVIAWPVDFQLSTYKFVISNPKFYTAFGISVERTLLGIVCSMVLTILAAYPLSLSRHKFKARGFYVWYFLITMLFGGGLIPTYLIVNSTGLIDTIWALIIPNAVPIFNVILLQNFLKEIPYEISEAAYIDGAGHGTLLTRILLPLSKPVIATLILFVAVYHWNSWFDGMIFLNSTDKFPLQTYLQTIVVKVNINAAAEILDNNEVVQKNAKAAQIVVAMLPILAVYPFLQKYFTKGIVMGSVKG
ncbi:MAG: transporter permease subunit [Paenibacillaceae bacterium]|jgi:putative aldouronate transport system permease protein|nr:transporter permease subunit [Paenibacillaceae bacterium]